MNGKRPDNFLRLIRRMQRGSLKIHLGYAAGVGKTYQMLLEAHRLKEDGVDVAVGLVETHGRSETEALLEGLEVIPRRKIVYRGIVTEELDLGKVLTRRPYVVLIDELAHTNVPGSKNAKRYQDVEEILYSGIHVISTLNIQHLESLYETVERATGVKVRERIPDHIVAGADQIVNVDITTEDLRRRLQEGKVYTAEQVETALDHFFKAANLEQLRELTLRELAAQIDSRTRAPLSGEVPSSPDQVMVCLSSKGPRSEALLRYASRLAGRLNRNWYAVYVQTYRESPGLIDASTQQLLSNTLTLAQQLGATVFTYRGDDIVQTILKFAKEYRVGHIVIGSAAKKLPFLKRLFGKVSIVERLITESSGINVVALDTKTISQDRPAQGAPRSTEVIPLESLKPEDAAQGRSVLSTAHVLIWNELVEKEEAVWQLLNTCCRDFPDLRTQAWDALLQREMQGGTFVGEEVAIPHTRLPGLDHHLVAFGISSAGIEDDISGQAVKLMILLISPLDPPGSHVEMLSVISRMARDDQWRREVLSGTRSSDILGLIRRWEEAHKGSGFASG